MIMSRMLQHGSDLPRELIESAYGYRFNAMPPQHASPPSQITTPVSMSHDPDGMNASPEASALSAQAPESTTSASYLPEEFSPYNLDLPDWTFDLSLNNFSGHEISSNPDESFFADASSMTSFVPLPPEWSLPYCLQDLTSFETSVPNEEQDSVVSRLSETKGTLHNFENGDLRYFGATSNLNLLDSEPPFYDHIEEDTYHARGKRMVECAGLGHAIEPELINHLINLYFAWQDSSFHVVDRDAYETQRRIHHANPDDNRGHIQALTNIM